MERLAGKVAVVTGASKGMGRHFVAALVGAGMRVACLARPSEELASLADEFGDAVLALPCDVTVSDAVRSEEHTSELQSLMRISYAVFCLKKKKTKTIIHTTEATMQTDKSNKPT